MTRKQYFRCSTVIFPSYPHIMHIFSLVVSSYNNIIYQYYMVVLESPFSYIEVVENYTKDLEFIASKENRRKNY